jgi:hypothetical protein
MGNSSQADDPANLIIKPDYIPSCIVYAITKPKIESGDVYFFKTNSGLLYEVRFARKKENYMAMVVNFSVLSDEFENEYAVTNRGEIFSIVATVVEIVKIFHHFHIFTNSYEFSGEYKDDEKKEGVSIRSRFYIRCADKVLNKTWKTKVQGNKVVLFKE